MDSYQTFAAVGSILVMTIILSVFIRITLLHAAGKELKARVDRTFFIVLSALAPLMIILYLGSGSRSEFFKLAVFNGILVAAGYYDFKTNNVPGRLVGFGILSGILWNAIGFERSQMLNSALGFLLTLLLLLLLRYLTRGGIGWGDILITACAGLYLGFQSILAVLVISTFLSGITGLVLLVLKRAHRKTTFPYIPFLIAGEIIIVLGS